MKLMEAKNAMEIEKIIKKFLFWRKIKSIFGMV
jgi:hypothetical protein